MKAIPKSIHIIWIGGDLPDRNRACVATFPKVNPDWKTNLWIDKDQLLTGLRRRTAAQHYEAKNNPVDWVYPTGVTPERKGVTPAQWEKVKQKVGGAGGDEATIQYLSSKFGKSNLELRDIWWNNWISLRQFCKDNEIQLRTVDEIAGSKLLGLYRNEMLARGTNFGAASDLLRIEILAKFGGVYFDTDVICTAPIGSVICHQSYPRFSAVDSHWVGKGKSVTKIQWEDDDWWRKLGGNIPQISNSIIASHAKCDGLKRYQTLIRNNFKALQTSDAMRQQYTNDIRTNTIQMTGPTAAAKGSGFAAIKKEQQDKAMSVAQKGGDLNDATWASMLFMRDNWYFPMYLVSDQYFHDWLK